MRSALVTGGAGFIGFHLAKRLVANGRKVVIADNLFRGKRDAALNALLAQPNVEYRSCDLTKPEEVAQLGENYDEVYHLAAVNGTKFFYEKPIDVMRVNIVGSFNLLDWFADSGSKNILFSSSSETYAGTMRKFGIPIPTPEDVPLCVEDPFNARWSYGASKIIGELLFINYARTRKFPMRIIRYHNIYGPRMGDEHVIPEFCKRIFSGETPFKIYGGKETRAFCYIADAVRATVAVMESTKTDQQIVHIGKSDEEVSITDLAKQMFGIAKVNPKIDILPAPAGSVQRRCPDTRKLKTLTGFSASVPLAEGLRETMAWYQQEYAA